MQIPRSVLPRSVQLPKSISLQARDVLSKLPVIVEAWALCSPARYGNRDKCSDHPHKSAPNYGGKHAGLAIISMFITHCIACPRGLSQNS